ncbi:MAG: GIY-YIG nuclease family protein [Parahaliea sp.]
MAANSGWQVYILECADGSLYTGVARDMGRRLAQHNGERPGGPRYTRGRRPVRLCWCEGAADRAGAQRREAAIKRLSRGAKLTLIASA